MLIAAIATLQKLSSPVHKVYQHVEHLGQILEDGLKDIFEKYDHPFYVARQGSAFCVYFMDHQPVDFHDIAMHHDFAFDKQYRHRLIEKGIFNFPLPIKQGSISFAHSIEDIEKTLEETKVVTKELYEQKLNLSK